MESWGCRFELIVNEKAGCRTNAKCLETGSVKVASKLLSVEAKGVANLGRRKN